MLDKSLNTEDFDFNSLLTQTRDKLLLVKFYADWCPPCKQLAVAWKKLKEQLHEKSINDVILAELKFENQADIFEKYQVKALPTIIPFWKSQALEDYRHIGVLTCEQLEKLITEIKLSHSR